jgi:capsular exopolysaccharide synthesis family protein
MLLANLRYFAVDDDVRCVLVTSSRPGEGKSTVAASLAFAAMEAGQSVVLLEADLRRPSLSGRLGLVAGEGLGGVLTGTVDFEQAAQRVPAPFDDLEALPGGRPYIDVLTAGATPPNPADLLASDKMRELVERLKTQYDLVVVDTAPAGAVPDTVHLFSVADGTLVVSRIDVTETEALTALRSQVMQGTARILGLVVNAEPRSGRADYYGYYGYGQAEPTLSAKT